MTIRIIHADCRQALAEMESDSVDACVTDPPYGLEFMGKEWDAPWRDTSGGFSSPGIGERKTQWPSHKGSNRSRCATCGLLIGQGGSPCRCEHPRPRLQDAQRMAAFQAWCEEWACEVYRVLKPGAHLIAFGGTRTYHRLVCAIEDAGFEVRDQIAWLFGSGFPKSHNLDGAWEGWGTALKPAHEPICLARKPLSGTVAANVGKFGVGALNVDASRIPHVTVNGGNLADNPHLRESIKGNHGERMFGGSGADYDIAPNASGRWPANVIHDGSPEVLAGFPETQSGTISPDMAIADRPNPAIYGAQTAARISRTFEANSGSAARFFYTAKADADDRLGSKHPTVKPVDLMAYLVRLVTPPGGVVLDPFAGSGTTGMACMREGFRAILIEREAEYVADIKRRIAHVRGEDAPLFAQLTA